MQSYKATDLILIFTHLVHSVLQDCFSEESNFHFVFQSSDILKKTHKFFTCSSLYLSHLIGGMNQINASDVCCVQCFAGSQFYILFSVSVIMLPVAVLRVHDPLSVTIKWSSTIFRLLNEKLV